VARTIENGCFNVLIVASQPARQRIRREHHKHHTVISVEHRHFSLECVSRQNHFGDIDVFTTKD
jgi:hypothetical protein